MARVGIPERLFMSIQTAERIRTHRFRSIAAIQVRNRPQSPLRSPYSRERPERTTQVMDYKLELVAIPVSDVDRAKAFYTDQVGFHADHDHVVSDEMRFV